MSLAPLSDSLLPSVWPELMMLQCFHPVPKKANITRNESMSTTCPLALIDLNHIGVLSIKDTLVKPNGPSIDMRIEFCGFGLVHRTCTINASASATRDS